MKKIKHRIEAMLLSILFAAFRSLPLDVASFMGGFMARSIGPFMSAHKTAERNLDMVFPKLTHKEKYQMLDAMWDNLGRVAAELPHLPQDALFQRVEIEGIEHLPPAGEQVIFFSGHLGNWEMTYPIAHRQGLKTTLIYRHANNPYVEKMIAGIRATRSTAMLAKGPRGAIKLLRAIKGGNALLMLVDQKMNDGIPVPFFGRDAMTAPAIAQLSLQYKLKIIPAKVIRTQGCHFKATIYPPLTYEATGDKEKDVLEVMTRINAMLESWIRENPEQWFWVHKRWSSLRR